MIAQVLALPGNESQPTWTKPVGVQRALRNGATQGALLGAEVGSDCLH